MRRLMLSAATALALGAGVSLVSSPASAGLGYETYTVFGEAKQVTVLRTTLFELYGFWPKGFDPVAANGGAAARPVTTDLDLLDPPGTGIGFVRKATLYWKYNAIDDTYEPKVSLTMYDYATVDYLRDPERNPSGVIPVGIVSPTGDLFVNPITNQPIGSVSPITTG